MEELNLDLSSAPNIVPLDLNNKDNDITKITVTKSDTSPSPNNGGNVTIQKVNSQPNLSVFTKGSTTPKSDKIVPTMGLDLLTDKKKVIRDNSSNDTQSMKDEILSRGSDKNMISAKENADDVLNMLNDTKPPVKTISDNLSNIDIASLDLEDNANKVSNFDFSLKK